MAGWIHGEEPEPVRSMPLLQAVAVAYDAAVSHAVGCGTCWPGMRLAEMCPDGQRAAIASLDTVPATAAERTHDEDDAIRTVADQVLRCICGAPVVWASGVVDFGWRHSPDSGRSCQRARPRCQECHMPHALLPGEPPLCRGIREHVTGPSATKATDAQAPLTSPGQRDGVRVEYRTRVPRGLVGAALAEAVTAIHREIQQQEGPPAHD
ncbi:MAG: hypothetical protein JF597_49925 [Streptomyces sp.]|uniref:hypothetical protein n=1 Tax=Streptomyces sp. TaxID=1931 RepID=UPI0025DE2B10|nr:hypothetical protein [Streptomyces sp.]MBW8801385.1 hypothetical protein [Streptomyces sp.]